MKDDEKGSNQSEPDLKIALTLTELERTALILGMLIDVKATVLTLSNLVVAHHCDATNISMEEASATFRQNVQELRFKFAADLDVAHGPTAQLFKSIDQN